MKKWCRTFLLSCLLCLSLCTLARAADGETLRVGLKYGSDAMSAANLQNYSAFGGYALGYFDADGSFEELGALPQSYEKITVTTDMTYHVQLSGTFYDYDDASRTAAQYSGGFATYEDGAFYARAGSYTSLSAARSAAAQYGGTAVGGSSTGVTVIVTGTDTILFEFDCGGSENLGILPIETREKTVTWFRGYRYYGGFEYQRVSGGNINVINVVDLEDYVKCVIPWEMSKDWPVEALKAQAVCARTYAVCQTKHRAQGFDICATTHCQVYQGTAASGANSDVAVDQTAGEFLYYSGRLVQEAVYYSSNGGACEVLLLIDRGDKTWECIVRPGKYLRKGAKMQFGNGELKAEIVDVLPDGNRMVKFDFEGIFLEVLEHLGKMPLPPYIKEELQDQERYQTVYSKVNGSAAAPTAGLHFTPELLEKIQAKGVNIGYVTLHVGLGTFRPVKEDDIEQHDMHSEYCVIPPETATLINETKARGGRVICVGTTSCRTLESWAQEDGHMEPSAGWTSIYIYPGYRFKVMDALVTNFHLPQSTLIMLVSALAGREHVLHAYEEAVKERYRFFSFGDAMFVS